MKKVSQHILLLLSIIAIAGYGRAQVVDAPDLHCVTVDNGGNIKLDWSLPVNVCAGPFNAYDIFYSNNINGPYNLAFAATNSSQTSYTHTVGNGGSMLYYYFMVSDYNCAGATFLHSDTLDNLAPVVPEINYTTVTGGIAQFNWEPSASPDAYGYILYHWLIGNTPNPFDTIYGRFNTTYTDITSTPGLDTLSYTVATIDSCINTGAYNELPQRTIFLEDTVLRCTQQVVLNWSSYNHWKNGVQQYDIFLSRNGGPSALLETVSSTTLMDTLSGFEDGDFLCFTIVARENASTFISTSNEVCVKVNIVQPAKDFYVRNVTVIAPNKIAVHYSMDPLADITGIEIDRAADAGNFSKLSQFIPPADLSIINVFVDSVALTAESSYYYRFIATDSCSHRDTSTIGKSVLLGGYAFSDLSFYLKWDESFFDFGKVLSYDFSRDDGSGFNPLTSLSPEIFVYEEKNLPTTTPCYYLEAIDSLIFPNGIRDTIHSRSNVLCLNQPSQIYMPNAFSPLGKNNIFKPVLNVQSIKTYSFLVFNRWGEQLFATEDPSEGWDGVFKGRYVQQGAYAYVVKLLDETGKNVEAKGTVMVIR